MAAWGAVAPTVAGACRVPGPKIVWITISAATKTTAPADLSIKTVAMNLIKPRTIGLLVFSGGVPASAGFAIGLALRGSGAADDLGPVSI